MFEKFGRIEKVEDFNELALNLKKEGDIAGLGMLARENGFDDEWADAFLEGELGDEFSCWQDFAYNRLSVEFADLKGMDGMIFTDWVSYIKSCLMEDVELCEKVCSGGKTLAGAFGQLLKWSFENAKKVDKAIVDASGAKGFQNVKFGIPDMGAAKGQLLAYYRG